MPLRRRRIGRATSSSSSSSLDILSWHDEIIAAVLTDNWDNLRRILAAFEHRRRGRAPQTKLPKRKRKKNGQQQQQQQPAEQERNPSHSRISLWSRITHLGSNRNMAHNNNHNNNHDCNRNQQEEDTTTDHTGLLHVDEESRTPLHLLLAARTAPTDLILQVLDCEPRQAARPNNRGRLPLHLAVVHRHDATVVRALVDAFPAAISVSDVRQRTPLQYAMDLAKRMGFNNEVEIGQPRQDGYDPGNTDVVAPTPRTYWAPVVTAACAVSYSAASQESSVRLWQEQQAERWSTVHWLLLSSATHPQTCLSIGGKKPMLVDALLNAAPPAVVSLLVGASAALLAARAHDSNRATAFAGTTLYTCIARHYPLAILQSLTHQCPADAARIRDETGMGLTAAQFLSGLFAQCDASTQEWTVVEDFYQCLQTCIREGKLDTNNALLMDWWSKIEFLIAFCAGNQKQSENEEEGGRSVSTAAAATTVSDSNADRSIPKKHFLLHAALTNTDVPPLVVRMILALYPDSIHLRDPVSSALPLHLVAMHRDYIPRSFEVFTCMDQEIRHQQESVLETVLAADPLAVRQRHEQRLPLHHAIAAGRQMETLLPLLKAGDAAAGNNSSSSSSNNNAKKRCMQLLQRDPATGLFPFQLAASYQPNQTNTNSNESDTLRWTCTARNKYSNAVWRGLSERQKKAAVTQVAESEDLARLDTIYRLLRKKPGAIDRLQQQQQQQRPPSERLSTRQSKDNKASTPSERLSTRQSRDNKASTPVTNGASSANTSVASLYIGWCFTAKDDGAGGRLYSPNPQNQDMIAQAIQFLRTTGSYCLLPDSFDTWWDKMKTCIRDSCRQGGTSLAFTKHAMTQIMINHSLAIPVHRDEFLLHAAVSLSDTPPLVIRLMKEMYSSASSLYLPGTFLLPLHIISGTPSYIPRWFEQDRTCSLEIVLRAHPAAVRVARHGRLPLHIAISAGKSLAEIAVLVNEEPRAVSKKDPRTGFYPFQLMACRREQTEDDRLRLERMACSRMDEKDWTALGAIERAEQVQVIRKEHELDQLDSVFLLLRRNASLLEDGSADASSATVLSGNGDSILHQSMNSVVGAVSDAEGDDNSLADDSPRSAIMHLLSPRFPQAGLAPNESAIDAVLNQSLASVVAVSDNEGETSEDDSQFERRRSSLLQLLSQQRPTEPNDEVYECDSTVITTVDILSSLNSTRRDEGTISEKDDNYSDDDSIDASFYDEFAEDSEIQGSSVFGDSMDLEQTADNHVGTDTKETDKTEVSDDDDDEESTVSFEIRRVSRVCMVNMLVDSDDEGFSDVQSSHISSKKPPLVSELKPYRRNTTKQNSTNSIVSGSSGMASEPSRFSFIKAPEENVNKLQVSMANMMWMNPDLLQPRVLKDSSQREDDDSSISMSLPSKSEPINACSASSGTVNSNAASNGTRRKSSIAKPKRNGSLLGKEPIGGVDDDDDDDEVLNGALLRGATVPQKLANSLHGSDHVSDMEALNSLEASLHNRPHGAAARSMGDFDESCVSSTAQSASLYAFSNSDNSFELSRLLACADESVNNHESASSAEQSRHVSFSIRSETDAELIVAAAAPEEAGGNDTSHAIKHYIFDKVAFKWMVSPIEREEGPIESSSSSESPTTVQKPEMTFDRKTMRWVAKHSLNKLDSCQNRKNEASETSKHSGTHFIEAPPGKMASKPKEKRPRRKSKPVGMLELTRNRLTCLLCNENGRDVLMIPCRHLCICRRCSAKDANINSCPLCNGVVAGRMLIY